MSEFLPAEHYLPHAAPMVLVEKVMHIDADSAWCQVTVSAEGILAPFLNAQGELPAWFGVEIIAQTIGVWSGWHSLQHQQRPPRPGMLLGGRGYRCQHASFAAGSRLDVRITLLMRDDKIGSFDGEITIDGALVASGRLNTWQPDEDEFTQLVNRTE
ncbi:3-hydroxy-fatty acyl-ACP dehydratase [Paramixta manurensis]|uniref:3-hydroxy-fatty acyl-ACP dehydratase n=1 Tax=Paramixta manurensis TaxID=2740817 RepID=A0A6M8UCT7_9GAMM|nr:3-hydroxy-fatty acyl-ACP dehydratase [Erwiniaceae bacterium PD-1]